MSVSDAETVSASDNLLSAHDVHVHSAILSAAYVSGEDTASVSLTGNRVELSNVESQLDSDFENGLTIYGARAAISGNAEISRNEVSVKDVTAADLRLYGGRYWAVGLAQNASVVMNGNLLEVENVTNTGPEADLWRRAPVWGTRFTIAVRTPQRLRCKTIGLAFWIPSLSVSLE